jgi:acyl-CoA thioester hydrolase
LIRNSMRFVIHPYDIDVVGIVSNIVYVRWLEDLRFDLLGRRQIVRVLQELQIGHVVVHTEIDYRASLRFGQKCTGRMELAAIGRTSVRFVAVFSDRKETAVTEAAQVCVFIDDASGKPVLIPDKLRAALEGREIGRKREAGK